MFIITGVSLSIIVILSGLYFLAKSKKEELGQIYVFSGYASVIIGFFLMFSSVFMGAMHMRHHCMTNKCGKQYACHMSQTKQCHGHCEGKSECHGKCGKMKGHGAHFGHQNHHGEKAHHHRVEKEIIQEIEIEETE